MSRCDPLGALPPRRATAPLRNLACDTEMMDVSTSDVTNIGSKVGIADRKARVQLHSVPWSREPLMAMRSPASKTKRLTVTDRQNEGLCRMDGGGRGGTVHRSSVMLRKL